jgi:sugar phosphate permease
MIKDLSVARGSLLLLIIGPLTIAWAPLPVFLVFGTMIFACGVGYNSALRSLVTSLVHPDQVGRLYAVMAIGDTIGASIFGPLLSKSFGWGLDLGYPWTGMAFIFCGVMFVILGLPLWLVRKPTPEMDVHG